VAGEGQSKEGSRSSQPARLEMMQASEELNGKAKAQVLTETRPFFFLLIQQLLHTYYYKPSFIII
jgi:hypothetical protein